MDKIEIMEISPEKLEKLETWEYEELKFFKSKKQQYWRVFWWLALILFLASNIFLFISFLNLSNDVFKCLSAIYFIVTLLFFFEAIEGQFDDYYTKFFNYFFKRTKTNSIIEKYESYFIPIEKQIEEEAISILSGVEKEARIRLSDNRNINHYLRLKRKRELYLYEIEQARKNYELNQKTLAIVDKNIEYIKFDLEKRNHFKNLQRDLRNEYVKWLGKPSSIQNIVNKLSEIKNSNLGEYEKTRKSIQNQHLAQSKEKTDNQANPLSINIEPIKRQPKNTQSQKRLADNESIKKFDKQSSEIKKPEKNINTKQDKNPVDSVHKSLNQLEFDFESPSINPTNLNEIPTKRNTLKYERIIKCSPDFYQNVANKKIEIGLKGELLVMEYEKQRLIKEGENVEKRLQHSSIEVGDGLGYDIRSFECEEEIYIEVKTTIGSFWSNLFFTQNEYEKMNKFGEQYYLYRICNFDIETNLGDLFIFKGKEMIDSYFDFKSTMYVLTQK